MTKIEEIDTGATKVGPYSHGIKVGEFIFTSGQVADQNVQGIANQTRGALEKIKKILKSAGTGVSNIVKTTIYLKNMSDFKEMNDAYKEFFQQNNVKEKFPARTTIEATCPLPNGLIEIDAIAVL
ncbi:MAG: RidA family protein [Promethearchaeota archaeon]|jgi:2-iminobutanoate/2-iminopropanoate deaminase